MLSKLHAGLVDGLLGCYSGELLKAVAAAGLFGVHILFRAEILDLAGYLYQQVRSVEEGDWTDPRDALEHIVPTLLHGQTKRCDRAHTGDYDAFWHPVASMVIWITLLKPKKSRMVA